MQIPYDSADSEESGPRSNAFPRQDRPFLRVLRLAARLCSEVNYGRTGALDPAAHGVIDGCSSENCGVRKLSRDEALDPDSEGSKWLRLDQRDLRVVRCRRLRGVRPYRRSAHGVAAAPSPRFSGVCARREWRVGPRGSWRGGPGPASTI